MRHSLDLKKNAEKPVDTALIAVPIIAVGTAMSVSCGTDSAIDTVISPVAETDRQSADTTMDKIGISLFTH